MSSGWTAVGSLSTQMPWVQQRRSLLRSSPQEQPPPQEHPILVIPQGSCVIFTWVLQEKWVQGAYTGRKLDPGRSCGVPAQEDWFLSVHGPETSVEKAVPPVPLHIS